MRQPKPYFKTSHKCWYINISGKPVRLDPDKEKAMLAYHALMAGTREITSKTMVLELIVEFLDVSKKVNAPRTYKFYKDHLECFSKTIGKLKVSELRPWHVERWITKRYAKTNNGNTLCNAIRSVQRVTSWAKSSGRITVDPLIGYKKPQPTSRDVYLTSEQYTALIAAVPDDAFRDLLILMRESGCRPQEARLAEARHFDRAGRCLTFAKEEAKGKKEARVILLNERAFEIIQKRAFKYPEGPLFVNRKGNRFSKDGLVTRCARMSKKLKFHVCPYAVRHTFATDAIVRGVDLITIAALMGHKSLNMLQRFYSHINKRADHLREGLRKATDAA